MDEPIQIIKTNKPKRSIAGSSVSYDSAVTPPTGKTRPLRASTIMNLTKVSPIQMATNARAAANNSLMSPSHLRNNKANLVN